MKRILILLMAVVVVFSGCNRIPDDIIHEAHSLWESPEPLPDFISNIYAGGSKICVDVWHTFYSNVTSNLRLEEQIETVNYELNGKSIELSWAASNRNIFTSCIDIRFSFVGIHKVTFLISDFDGNIANYNWAFHVKKPLLGLDHEGLQHNIVLPSF